jgi:hypothetical protein
MDQINRRGMLQAAGMMTAGASGKPRRDRARGGAGGADLSMMIWSVAEQISKRSEAFELMPGDLMEGHIDGLPNLSVRVV